jgi:adenine-specific DNA-methyltransferase
MSKVSDESQNLTDQNIESLKQLFPEAFISGKLNFETLQELLGDEVEESQERYGLSWNGKNQAKRIVKQTTTSTLKPYKDESKDWDTTKNVFIEGDNLEVLKILQKSYKSKIKMIYIDPPYNTGKDFVYKDDFNDNLQNYLKYTGQVDEDGRKLSTNPESDGRYHDKWLSMMYPRLKLARNLLRDDGVIFISIDDHEVQNLRYICDEVFGSDNFVGQLVWKTATDNNPSQVAIEHEYILAYVKNKNKKEYWEIPSPKKDLIISEYNKLKLIYTDLVVLQNELRKFIKNNSELEGIAHYKNVDENGVYFSDNISDTKEGGYDYEVLHPLTNKNVKKPKNGYRYPLDTFKSLLENGQIQFGKDETTVIQVKKRVENATEKLRSVFYKDGRASSKGLVDLMEARVFDNPKDTQILAKLIDFVTEKDSLILDFFAGSGSTAQAVMELNSKNNTNRNYICVQLPELFKDEDKLTKQDESTKNAYDFCRINNLPFNIASLTKKRIKKAGERIKKEYPLEADNLDVGFRVFKLVDTNFPKWNKESVRTQEDLYLEMDKQANARGLDPEAVLFETLLKEGVDLALAPDTKSIELGGNKIFVFDDGQTLVCIDPQIHLEMFNELLKLPNIPAKVICLEDGLATDEIMINAEHIMKKNNIIFKTI